VVEAEEEAKGDCDGVGGRFVCASMGGGRRGWGGRGRRLAEQTLLGLGWVEVRKVSRDVGCTR
jgi:hypothetical protein